MSLPIRFNENIPKELNQIRSFYEQESGPELASSFHDKLINCLARIERNPKRFSFFQGDIRRANLDRFPYAVLYRIKSDCIRILVLRHTKQHPDHGLRRK